MLVEFSSKTICAALFAGLVFLSIPASTTLAQRDGLSREVREKFESMLNDLEDDLREKFQKAIDSDSPVVSLNAEQLRKFQNNAVNPFDISDIDPNDIDGKIELRFELPSIRNRPVKQYERQSRSLRRNLRPVVRQTAGSTVKITNGKEQIALGTIVREDGMILTKASEVTGKDNIYCVLGANRKFSAEIVRENEDNDLALLKIETNDLTPVIWSSKQVVGGAFVVTPNQLGEVVSLGSYSVVPRSTVGENRALLGVNPQTVQNGVVIAESVEVGSAAYSAGLIQGDIITAIDDFVIREVDELVNEIRKRRAGDQIRITFLRSGISRTTKAKLSRYNLSGERAARFKMMSRLGAVPSERQSNFPSVFQHDSPLFPEQCGGPICDLEGNVLGINIARESRAASFAIPASHIQTLLQGMFRYDVASRNGESR